MFNQTAGPVSVRDNLLDSVPTAIAKGRQPNTPSIVQASCLHRIDLLQRRIFATYDGAVFSSVAGKVFPWVMSKQVPVDKYWVLMFASLLTGPKWVGPDVEPGLWLLPNASGASGQSFRPNVGITDGTDPFFLSYSTVVKQNYGPPAVGLRIDDGFLNTFGNADTILVAGEELTAFKSRPYILMAPGEQLLGYCVNDAAAPTNGGQLELRIAYAELQLGEEFDVF